MTTVLFVAGAGRSGSTLLSSVLGQSTGVVDVGEVWKMWRLRQEPDRFCGCGSRLDACPFWEAVATASPGLYDPDPEVMVAMARIGHARGSWRLWAQLKAGRGGVDAYAERLGRLYRSVAEVSGARVIVDSSKMPGPGLVAGSIPGITLKVLHLTRDPRAVAASWAERKEGPSGVHHLEARAPGRVASAWMTRALATETILRQASDAYCRLAYERFAMEPEHVIDEVLGFVGEASGSPAFVAPSTVQLESTHSTGGNPGRFSSAQQEIRLDERWRSQLDLGAKRKVDRITTPLRQLYGYH